MQKEGSSVLSHTGLKYYSKRYKKIFEEVKRKHLTRTWKDAACGTQIKEMAHITYETH